jgi:uncharacterized coiled-coil DUF342 family protein
MNPESKAILKKNSDELISQINEKQKEYDQVSTQLSDITAKRDKVLDDLNKLKKTLKNISSDIGYVIKDASITEAVEISKEAI